MQQPHHFWDMQNVFVNQQSTNLNMWQIAAALRPSWHINLLEEKLDKGHVPLFARTPPLP